MSEVEPCRVIVVDDSAVIRGIFRRTLEDDPEITVVASASNGQNAIDVMARHPTDIVVLDIEMPVMDGLTALPKLLEIDPGVRVIIASTLTQRNADISLQALKAGAADYIPKPTAKHAIHSADAFKRELLEKVKALGRSRQLARRRSKRGAKPGQPAAGIETASTTPSPPPVLQRSSALPPQILCIGSSTGGPQALMNVIGGLKDDFNLPILITQHMPKTFTAMLAQHLERIANRPSAEAVDGEPVLPNRIYVAPGERHMLVTGSKSAPVIRLNDGPAENFCKPAVDPMLRSVVQIYGARVLTVILTGMGHDGLIGARNVVEAGGALIAQDEATSVVWGMPGAVANAGLCNAILPLTEIADHILKIA